MLRAKGHTPMAQHVTQWFDVSCPFAWMTAKWLKEAKAVRGFELEFSPMSLSILNDGADIPADYGRKMAANWGPARVFAKVKDERPEKVEELYWAMATLIHEGGQAGKEGTGSYDPVIAEALEQVGLDASFAEVANDEYGNDALAPYHRAAMEAVGEDTGTPVVQIDGAAAFFGPVITRLPVGEEAGELFDATERLAQYPWFFSVNRARTETPDHQA